ncbi:RbsD/FucU domain-containing protein, partial [Rhizobium leguminosarum]|uniref:RbsD/FucU domain-containing protein n=1 Tax=Rhizobium leguminosarum TaxID=384 RepID=UPI003F9765B1
MFDARIIAVDDGDLVAVTHGDKLDPVHEEMIDCCARQEPHRQVVPLIGQDFYGRVKNAHALIQTGEPRLYANIILRKG